MKQNQKLLLATALILPFTAGAVDVFVGEVDDDYYYSNSVKVEGVVLPADLDSEVGSSTINLSGSGTITIGANAGGGFPRISVVGGTTITSTRNFTGVVTKDWWDGTLEPPRETRVPSKDLVTGVSDRYEITPIEAYTWGANNEKFFYSISATIALPVSREQNGAVLHSAELEADGSWKTTGDTCVLQDGLCVLEVNSGDQLLLYKVNYNQCPVAEVENGEVGSTPGCLVSCNIGYVLGCDGKSCHPRDCTGSSCPELCGGFNLQGGADDPNYEGGKGENVKYTGNYKDFYRAASERYVLKPSDRRFQDLRYRGSNADEHVNFYDEDGLDEEELAQVRAINAGKLSRDLRGDVLERNGVEDVPREKNSDLLDYMVQMRNRFSGNNDVVVDMPEEITTEDTEELYASAPMLPSTGPGLFILVAIIGVGLMVLGAFKRD